MARTQEQEIIFGQMTLRAVVWDVLEPEKFGDGGLEKELEIFQVCVVVMGKRMIREDCELRYEQAVRHLEELGILEAEALLVTEEAGMAEYVYGLRKNGQGQEEGYRKGMGVVFYEQEGSRTDVVADMIVQGFEEIGVQFLDRVQKRRNGLPWNILYTERTCVREIRMEDLDELYELYEGEGITNYIEPLYERQTEEEYTRSYIDYMYYYYGYGMWVILHRKTGRLIGRAGIEHREAGEDAVMELGYIIRADMQKQGYATEVCQAIVSYAKQELGIEELHCFIHPQNQVSVHVAEKLGFERCRDTEISQDGYLDYKKML